jgi:hypothetical protein
MLRHGLPVHQREVAQYRVPYLKEPVMKLTIASSDVWAATIQDQPGGLASKLEALSQAGANLAFVIARRSPENPGQGVVFVTPIAGSKQKAAAESNGFIRTGSLHSLRIEGVDKPGLCGILARKLAEAGINRRGMSATTLGKRFVMYLALDSIDDLSAARRALRKI